MELVEKASTNIKDMKISREKDLMNRFMMEIKKSDGGLGVYGEANVLAALRAKTIDLLLVSEDLDKSHVLLKCPNCGNEREMFLPGGQDTVNCEKCGTPMTVVQKEDFLEYLFHLAEASGAKTEIISDTSEEGKLLERAFGGIAGILRYVPKEQQIQ